MNVPNAAYSNQHIDTEVIHSLKDHTIAPDTIKATFTLDLEPID